MKILEIASFFPPMGGSFVVDQARALQAAGHEVQILYCNQVGLSHGIRQWLFPNQPHCLRSLPKLTHLNQRRWVANILRQYRAYVRIYGIPDVIHSQCGVWAGSAAYLINKKNPSIPYFITEHIPVELFEREFGANWSKHPWAGELMRDVYRHARCVIHVAPEQYDWLAPFFGRDYNHTVISNVIDTAFFQTKKSLPKQGGLVGLLCLSISDVHRKGLDVLASAMSELTDCELTLAGRGTDSAPIKSLFATTNRVHHLGELDREGVRQLLSQSDVLVLPSRSEVQPLVLLEAMCMGIPVVTTDAVTVSVRIPDASFVAKVGDAHSLAVQIRAAIAHGPLSISKISEIRAMVSPSAIASQLTALFLQ